MAGCQTLSPGAVVGIDGECVTYREADTYEEGPAELNAKQEQHDRLFLNAIWNDRPELPMNPVFIIEEKYSGRSTQKKLERLRKQFKEKGCSHIILNSLDQIAWLFNIRCHDIPYNPVAVSYVLVDENEATLFVSPGKVSENVRKVLREQGVDIMPYDSLPDVLSIPADGTGIMQTGTPLITTHSIICLRIVLFLIFNHPYSTIKPLRIRLKQRASEKHI
jgi:Xaa-Pro aminopeptidase